MKDIKIFVIVALIVGVLYWGVEPLAHSVFYPKTAPEDFAFSDLEQLPTTGNAENGKILASTYCIACHSIEQEGFPKLMDDEMLYQAYGVVPPDLSRAGAIYDGKFLANLIKDPVKAVKLSHKFNDTKPFPMTPTFVSDEEIGDIVAYFQSVGARNLENLVLESEAYQAQADIIKKSTDRDYQRTHLAEVKNHLMNKEIFKDACSRCHSMKYDNLVSSTPPDALLTYMGAAAPDLSMMIRSRGQERLSKFINEPEKILPGTAMPRVGLTAESQERVIKYMESIGDSRKAERESLGVGLIAFMVVLAALAYLWKRKIWSELH